MRFWKRATVIELPAIAGERMSHGEVASAMRGALSMDAMRAVVQVIWLRREQALSAMKGDAYRNADTRFQAGAATALEELLDDLQSLDDGKMNEDIKAHFGGKTS